jgi:predicted Zn-dependent protease
MRRLTPGLPLLALLPVLAGCAVQQARFVWKARELAFVPTATIELKSLKQEPLLKINRETVQKLLLAHIRISRTANVQSELLFMEGEDPNAFAGLTNGQRSVTINSGMLKLIGDDINEFAALLGHETAHWVKGHGESGKTRASTLQALGTLAGVGLAMAGVPAAGSITGLGADMIDASFSRDEEREADALGLEYMLANRFDPWGAVRLHQRILNLPGGLRIPFLSSHPSSEERIENLKRLIESKQAQAGPHQDDQEQP